MIYDPEMHHRRSIRIKEYDYTQTGAYFITICTFKHKCLFGEIRHGEMRRSRFGEIAADEWEKTIRSRPYILPDEWVIMPNHFHAIVLIRRGHGRERRTVTEHFGAPTENSVPTVIRAFKSAVSNHINKVRGTSGSPVWQRNYYEHIIRGEEEYQNAIAYIRENPLAWDADHLWTT